MAIFGPFAVTRVRLEADPRFTGALRYVEELLRPGSPARRRIDAIAPGATEKINLDDGAFALEQAYAVRPRAECFFESHRRFIDVQVIVEGAEVIEVEDVGRLAITQAYDADKDLIKYADTAAASRLALRAGDAAVFFPADGHMPCLADGAGPGLVRKSVVKVPLSEA